MLTTESIDNVSSQQSRKWIVYHLSCTCLAEEGSVVSFTDKDMLDARVGEDFCLTSPERNSSHHRRRRHRRQNVFVYLQHHRPRVRSHKWSQEVVHQIRDHVAGPMVESLYVKGWFSGNEFCK